MEAEINHLENRISMLTHELQLAKLGAEAAAQAKTRFLRVISHELMTPLQAIMGFSCLINTADIAQTQKEQAKHITEASEQLILIFEEVLAFIQLNSGELIVKNKHFLPTSFLASLTKSIKMAADSKGLSVTTHIDSKLSFLVCDETLLRHAIEILLSNAVKFTHQGNVGLSVRLINKLDGDFQVEFAVKDTGVGISLALQKQLFRAFEPLDSSLTRCYAGIGLGLVVCEHLVKLMGGELLFESNVKAGSLFRINLWMKAE
ncbi:MAG: ATP-binding protein [Methylococcales bacterium]|nr:ATP-binding protein [Methylococcales bacterium]